MRAQPPSLSRRALLHSGDLAGFARHFRARGPMGAGYAPIALRDAAGALRPLLSPGDVLQAADQDLAWQTDSQPP